MTEDKLKGVVAVIGQEAAARVDPNKMADAVVRRLRERRQGPALPPLWVQIAAAIVFAVGIGSSWFDSGVVPPVTVATEVSVLADLTVTELDEVIDSLGFDESVATTVGYSLNDLSVAELEQLLEEMETVEG